MDNLQEYKTKMPNCEQLYKDLQVSWEVFGDQATIEIAAKMGKFLETTNFFFFKIYCINSQILIDLLLRISNFEVKAR